MNPLLNPNKATMQQMLSLVSTFQNNQNPMQTMQQMAQNDSTAAKALQMFNSGNPQEVVKNLCKERGIDFNSLVNMARTMGIPM